MTDNRFVARTTSKEFHQKPIRQSRVVEDFTGCKVFIDETPFLGVIDQASQPNEVGVRKEITAGMR